MKDIHYIQMHILKKLLFSERLRYSDLKPFEAIENNKLTFHLDRLIKDKHVEKVDDLYRLTVRGKEFANQMDSDNVVMQKQAKISVSQFCYRIIEGRYEFLIYTRLKHPFYGCQGFSSGKVKYGETIIEASRRELKEETNLEGDPELFSIRHFRVFDKETSELVEDKFMYFCRINDPKGDLIVNDEGKQEWVKEEDFRSYITKPFESIEDLEREVKRLKDFNGNVYFVEVDHETNNF